MLALAFVLFTLIPPAPVVVVPSTHGTCTKPDFDNDGLEDRVEGVPDSCGTGGCVYRLYLAKNDRFVGQIEGKCSFVVVQRPAGKLADIETVWTLGAKDAVVTRYRFNGRRYHVVRKRGA